MFARCGKFLVVIALVLTTGLHWAALQTVAWTTMLAANLTTESFSEAVADTFDGEHPCPLCKVVAAGKKSEQKSEATAPLLKMEFPPLPERMSLVAPTQFQLLAAQNFFADPLAAKPPLPPPRRCFV